MILEVVQSKWSFQYLVRSLTLTNKTWFQHVQLTKKTDEFTVKEDTEKFLRRVKLKAHFHDKEQPSDEPQRDKFESLKPKKSNWRPPDGQFTFVDLFVKKMPRRHPKTKFQQKPQIFKSFLRRVDYPPKS